jgi:allantoinase
MISANPARIFGVYPQKGSLQPGADADLIVVDLDKEWILSVDQLFYKNKHSAYIGSHFKGAVEQTIVRGTTVYQAGEIKVGPGFGRPLVRRQRYAYP